MYDLPPDFLQRLERALAGMGSETAPVRGAGLADGGGRGMHAETACVEASVTHVESVSDAARVMGAEAACDGTSVTHVEPASGAARVMRAESACAGTSVTHVEPASGAARGVHAEKASDGASVTHAEPACGAARGVRGVRAVRAVRAVHAVHAVHAEKACAGTSQPTGFLASQLMRVASHPRRTTETITVAADEIIVRDRKLRGLEAIFLLLREGRMGSDPEGARTPLEDRVVEGLLDAGLELIGAE